MDALADQIRAEMDRTKRKELCSEAQKTFRRRSPLHPALVHRRPLRPLPLSRRPHSLPHRRFRLPGLSLPSKV